MHEARPMKPTALPVEALVKSDCRNGLISLSESTVAAKPPASQITMAGTSTMATNMSEPWMKSVQHTAM